ncbi:lipid droplet-associated hydrolase isoform X1 [Ahaetulla prasina]|uniref:lipid droplet-associated hydrolase isoform X1 n=1 Tax=Ahaetulla prasina TaxID=499056 RepID=UPI002647F40B|nr:lipid droplet-associated hydrolase isoform X1 [Ahaetulla prasina]
MLGVGREPLNGEATSMNSDSKEQDLIHEEFTYISGALTQILKCGPWEDLWNDKSAPRVLFLVIPGNPGLVGFYRTFIEALYFSLNQQYPVWVVSHGGHCKIPHEIKRKEEMVSNDTDDVFGLQGQAEHKLKFLRKFVPKDVKLILIGHSIGSYLALKIMKHSPEVEILRSILLFPTIERMAQSPQGKLLTPLLCHLRYILYIPIYLFTLLPERVKSFLVPFALNWQKLNDETVVTTLVDMLNMDCIANIMYLGSQEMRSVQERDSSTIKQHLNKPDSQNNIMETRNDNISRNKRKKNKLLTSADSDTSHQPSKRGTSYSGPRCRTTLVVLQAGSHTDLREPHS